VRHSLFYSALSQAACCHSAASGERQQHLDDIAAHHKQLQLWAKNCPENFENRAALVGAEIARIEGRALDAMDLYEQAIRSAQANSFVHNEALANEVAGYFYLDRGLEKNGYAHLRDARACYALWGADGKVRQLDRRYPQLAGGAPSDGGHGRPGSPARFSYRRQSLSGLVQRDRDIQADRTADDDRA
jgi:hypothetical protein